MHIPIGYLSPNVNDSIELIKYMDQYVGLYSIIVDNDNRRRSLYGKAGCFRLTSYGVEYRTLSGYMLSNNVLLNNIYNLTMMAIEAFNSKKRLYKSVEKIINTGNKEKAIELFNKLKTGV